MKRLIVALAAVLLVAACGGSGHAERTATTPSTIVVPGSEINRFENIIDWQHADLVAVVTVKGATELPAEPAPQPDANGGEPSEGQGGTASSPTMRNVTVSVDRVLYGRAPATGTFTFRDFGWQTVKGARYAIVGEGEVRLDPGDRAIVALVGDGIDADHSALFTGSSTFKVVGSEIADSNRQNTIHRRIEAMSEPDAEAYVRAGT